MSKVHQRILFVSFLAVGLVPRLYAQDFSKIKIQTVPLTDNLYGLVNAGGNIILSTGEDGLLLVDTGYAEMADKLVAAVEAVSKKPIRLVIDTHWHFDHAGGNEKLAGLGAVIVAHDNVRKQMSEERFITVIDHRAPASPPAALPVISFPDSLTLHWNGDEIHILHVRNAHTDGDSIVQFKKANVLHVGDTCFNGMYPFMDVNSGGSLGGMVGALDQALALADENTKIIPGHGMMCNKTELLTYRNMLATVRDRVQELIAQGKSRDEIIAAKPTKEFDGKWGRSWLDPDTWVGLVYDGMKGK